MSISTFYGDNLKNALIQSSITGQPGLVVVNPDGSNIATGSGVVEHVIVDSGTLTAVTAITNALPAGTNVLGHVISDTGSTTAVTQATGTNLHTVVDSGTITTVGTVTTVGAVTAISNALPAGANVIGHVIADSGSTTAVTQATGTNLHTVVDSGTVTTVSAVTAITNALPAGTNLMGKVSAGLDATNMYSGSTALTPLFAPITASASGATTVVAAVTSKKIVVLGYVLVSNGTVNVKFQSHVTPTDLTGLLYLGANTGASSGFSPVGQFATIAGEALDINLSGNVAVGGHLVYVTI